jgi:DNA-binding transcriptional MerR regulator
MTTSYMTVGSVSRFCGVSPELVRAWAAQGRLRVAARTESGTRLFLRSDVERLAKDRAARKRVAG